jgi:hypothetical protein
MGEDALPHSVLFGRVAVVGLIVGLIALAR